MTTRKLADWDSSKTFPDSRDNEVFVETGISPYDLNSLEEFIEDVTGESSAVVSIEIAKDKKITVLVNGELVGSLLAFSLDAKATKNDCGNVVSFSAARFKLGEGSDIEKTERSEEGE